MKSIFVCFLATLFLPGFLFSQIRRDAIWCFGDSAGIDFNHAGGPLLFTSMVKGRGSCCSIADSSGQLLFYAQTAYLPLYYGGSHRLGVIFNRNHQVMDNGDTLVGDVWYYEMVIVPDPGNPMRYYLFHTGVTNAPMYYSLIDLSYHGGLGKVIQKNVLLCSFNGQLPTDGITAVKHGNGRDWWLIFRTSGSLTINTFYKFLITPWGISDTITQNIGIPTFLNSLRLFFNHTGTRLALIDAAGLVELFDFDRCSGLLSNNRWLHYENFRPEDFCWSAEFSPDDSTLYVSTNDLTSYLYQYDLRAANINSSRRMVDSISYPVYTGGALKLAPDGKIYWSCVYYDPQIIVFPYPDTLYNIYNTHLSVINNPDVFGSGCNFVRYGFDLGGRRTYLGLPNNPNYDLPALGGSSCDTLGLPNAIDQLPPGESLVSIYPNPARNFCRITGVQKRITDVQLKDVSGREVPLRWASEYSGNAVEVFFAPLPPGLYFIRIFTTNGFQTMKMLAE